MDKNTTYQTGNTAATKFESLVNRLYVSLCFAANRFLGDKTAAQDIVQEAFAFIPLPAIYDFYLFLQSFT